MNYIADFNDIKDCEVLRKYEDGSLIIDLGEGFVMMCDDDAEYKACMGSVFGPEWSKVVVEADSRKSAKRG